MQDWKDELRGRCAVLGLQTPTALEKASGQYLFTLAATLAVHEAARGLRPCPPGSMLETLSKRFGVTYTLLDMPPENQHEREERCQREKYRAQDWIDQNGGC